MKNPIAKIRLAIKAIMKEQGQDLVEYALVVALIAVGATAGMRSLATSMNTVFNNIGTSVVSITA
jgi:pilus assembly protein Flp/PilA